MIIRVLWIREDNIIIKPATNILIINSYGLIILIKITLVLLKIKKFITTPFIILIKRARKRQKPFTVFKVLSKDIIKALYPKVIRTLMEIRKLLLAQYYNYLPFFKGDMAAELLPHRPGMNYIFTLKKGKNK